MVLCIGEVSMVAFGESGRRGGKKGEWPAVQAFFASFYRLDLANATKACRPVDVALCHDEYIRAIPRGRNAIKILRHRSFYHLRRRWWIRPPAGPKFPGRQSLRQRLRLPSPNAWCFTRIVVKGVVVVDLG